MSILLGNLTVAHDQRTASRPDPVLLNVRELDAVRQDAAEYGRGHQRISSLVQISHDILEVAVLDKLLHDVHD